MSTFLEVLEKAARSLNRLTEQAKTARRLADIGRLDTALDYAAHLADTAERLTLLTRAVPCYTGRPSAKEDVQRIMREAIPVKIGFTAQGWFSLRIPPLLPQKTQGSVDYLRDYLYPAMQDFFRDKAPVQYPRCVLIFRHVYSRDRPERKRRNYSSIEANLVADIAAFYVMPGDNPSVCDHYHCCAAAEDDRTEVYVVPREEFPNWLEFESFMPDKGVELYGNCPEKPM